MGLGLPAQEYLARVVTINSHRFLARIDFRSPSDHNGFVDIFRASTPPGSIADVTVFQRLAEAFPAFLPHKVYFYHPAHLPLRTTSAIIEQHFLAAPATEMASRPPASGHSRITLTRRADLDFYPHYVAIYREMYAERPYLEGIVGIEGRESLEECAEQGFLFEIAVDGRAAGIIAAKQRTMAGLPGIYVTEIALDRIARGQALGPTVHQHFATAVSATAPQAVITGTVARENVPSWRAATRAGRIEIGAWYRLDLPS
jgi:L-amino acid N-acyltransferase YncA